MWLMGRPFVMVSAEEHTAQVPGEVRNRIENDFKSRQRTNELPGGHADPGDGRQHRGLGHGPDAERAATSQPTTGSGPGGRGVRNGWPWS